MDNVDCRAGCPGMQICFVNMDSGRCCLPAAMTCAADADCCVGACTMNTCACDPPGAECVRAGRCCAGSCSFGKCVCSQVNHPCGTGTDCCQGLSCEKGVCK